MWKVWSKERTIPNIKKSVGGTKMRLSKGQQETLKHTATFMRNNKIRKIAWNIGKVGWEVEVK